MAKHVKTLRKSLGEQETENKRLEKVVSDLEGRALKPESLLETEASQEKQSTARTPALSSNIRKREKLSRVKSPSRVRKQKAYGLQRGVRSDEHVAELLNNHMGTMSERVQMATSQELLWNGPTFLHFREPWTFSEDEEEQNESNAFADRLEEEEMARLSPEVLVVQVSNAHDEQLPPSTARAESKEGMSEKADTLLVSKSSEINNIDEENMNPLVDGLRDLSLNGTDAGDNGGVDFSHAFVAGHIEHVDTAQMVSKYTRSVLLSQQETSQTRGMKGQADAMQVDAEQIQTALPSPEHEDVQHMGQDELIDMTPVETMPTFSDSQGVEGLEIQHTDTGSQPLSPQQYQAEVDWWISVTEAGVSQMLESTSVPLIGTEKAEEMSGQQHSTTNRHINEDEDKAYLRQAETSGSPGIDGGPAAEDSPTASSRGDKGKGRAEPEHPEASKSLDVGAIPPVVPGRKVLVPRKPRVPRSRPAAQQTAQGGETVTATDDERQADVALRQSYAFRRSKLKRRAVKIDSYTEPSRDAAENEQPEGQGPSGGNCKGLGAGQQPVPKKPCNTDTLTTLTSENTSATAESAGQPLPPLVNDLTRVPAYDRFSKHTSPLDHLTWEEAVAKIEVLFSRGAPLWKTVEKWRLANKIDASKTFKLLLLCRQTMHVIDTIPREKEDLFRPCQFPRRLKFLKEVLAEFPANFFHRAELEIKIQRLFDDAKRLNMAGK